MKDWIYTTGHSFPRLAHHRSSPNYLSSLAHLLLTMEVHYHGSKRSRLAIPASECDPRLWSNSS